MVSDTLILDHIKGREPGRLCWPSNHGQMLSMNAVACNRSQKNIDTRDEQQTKPLDLQGFQLQRTQVNHACLVQRDLLVMCWTEYLLGKSCLSACWQLIRRFCKEEHSINSRH